MKAPYPSLLSTLLVSASLAAPAWSAGLLDTIKNQAAESLGGGAATTQASPGLGAALGGAGGVGSALGLPGISSSTAGNAAGVLQYCIQNKYLGAGGAASVKDQLLSKAGITTGQQKDPGYQQGLGGVLAGNGGAPFDLGKLKNNVKEKVCSYVLDNASSLL